MTKKQQNIFNTALELFATDGVDATSTSKIAKVAGVSEGLIFRHFTNKEGLLQAILTEGLNKAHEYFQLIQVEIDPKTRIRKALELPFNILPEEYNFWRLVYTLKWQRGSVQTEEMSDFRASLADAFDQLNYENPSAEARLVESIIDGIATEVLLKDVHPKPLLKCVLDKYKLK
ncbi:MAG: hypothetical protein COA38_14360 [Fluviicola sp.]|nr:MAG: hypothetical protein COA38_14360 [Fluviicola sp.]